MDSFDESMKPVEALQNLACLVESTSNVWTSTSGSLDCHVLLDYDLKIWEASRTSIFSMSIGNRFKFRHEIVELL